MELVDIDISQWFFYFSEHKCNSCKRIYLVSTMYVTGFWRPQGLLLNYIAFLGISIRPVSAIWGFYPNSKSSLVALCYSTNFTGPLAQSAAAEKPGQFCKVYRHSKIPAAAFDPNLLSQFLSLLCGVSRLYQVSGSSISRVITNHLSDSVRTKHPS